MSAKQKSKTSKKKSSAAPSVAAVLQKHFRTKRLHEMVTSVRTFPLTARLDLQVALDETLKGQRQVLGQHGVHARYISHDTITFAAFSDTCDGAPAIGPLQFDEIDVGDAIPARCLKRCLWLCEDRGRRFALLLSSAERFGRDNGLHVEIAMIPQKEKADLSRALVDEIEQRVSRAASYRGKVISLDKPESFSGKASGVKVHKLRKVARDQVILPDKTLRLLERNVSDFVRHREQLGALKMSVKKGLLFYGPPGTGKTHTIHYLASQLPDHTTLLITAEQVGMLDEYMLLARFLQPAMIVIEDADLIARERETMRNPCAESLLNKLLNEMDGLREDAMLMFILTTNRPESLEGALASRPGRVDQAIEFPLPDDDGRLKLIKLYSGMLAIDDDLARVIVRKTKGGSAAFIKELMRRAAQHLIQSGGKDRALKLPHVEAALDEMLFTGGSLNSKLLGVSEGK